MIKFIKMINEITTTEYFLTDALGSVRQMTTAIGEITLVSSYEPYGTSLSSAGDSESAYGFTGEYTDTTGNIYLRARYYNPNDGRFLTKDPSRLESNLYLYAMGNPINRIDPNGLYSIETINKNIPIENFAFEKATDIAWTPRSRWGFLALLLEAKDFDYIRVGALDLTHWTPQISYSITKNIWSINCDTIMVGSQRLSDYYQTEVKRQRTPGIYWRDTSARYYDLFRPLESPRSYVDGGSNIDYPYFRSISLGIGAEFNLLVDINGQFHLSFAGGAGSIVGLGYTEGYLCNYASCTDNINMIQLSEISNLLNGICVGGNAQLIAGIALSLCPSNLDPFAATGVATYYLGLEAGFGAGLAFTFSLPYQNSSLGWAKAVNDQLNGWDLSGAYMSLSY